MRLEYFQMVDRIAEHVPGCNMAAILRSAQRDVSGAPYALAAAPGSPSRPARPAHVVPGPLVRRAQPGHHQLGAGGLRGDDRLGIAGPDPRDPATTGQPAFPQRTHGQAGGSRSSPVKR